MGQKQYDPQDYDTDNYAPVYYINEEAKPRQAKMITNVDDTLQVACDLPPWESKGTKPEDLEKTKH